MLKDNHPEPAPRLSVRFRRLMPRSVRATLAWLFAGIIAPLAFASAGLLLEQRRADEAETRERLGTIAATLVAAIDAELERGQTLLEVLAASPQLRDRDLHALYTYAKQVVGRESQAAIVLVSADGQPLFSTGLPWGAVLPNVYEVARENRYTRWNGVRLPVSSGDLVSRVLRGKTVAYSNLYYAANVGRPALAVGVPASGPNGAAQVLILSVSPSLLQETVQGSVTVPRVRVVVADRNGLVVASNARSSASVGQPVSLTSAMLQRQSGFYSITAQDGVELHGAFAVSRKNGFVVRVAQPETTPLSDGSTPAWIGLYVVVLVTGIALVRIHSRRLTTPIRQLAAAVAAGEAPAVKAEGQLAEIELLAHAVGVASEATRLQQEADRRTISELQDRALFSEQMIGIVSHDLRHPLLAAQFSARALRGRDSSFDEGLDQIQAALEQAQAMSSELLDFTRARIGSGIPVDLQPLDLHQLLRSHLGALRRSYSQHLLLHEAVGDGPCEADPARLTQVLDNLVSNAAAYGSPRTPITIKSIVADDSFSIEVHNEGEPIPADILPQVFEPLVRSPTSHARRPGGVGLGLYIVRKIAEAHAGEVQVTSSRESGTTFTITLPR